MKTLPIESCYQVRTVVQNMLDGDIKIRAHNRSIINALFNGDPPYSEEEAKSANVETNVNFLEGTRLAMDARAQFNSAFLKPARFFTARIDLPDSDLSLRASTVIPAEINRIMKLSLPYSETKRSQAANIVLHGVAPVVWSDRFGWDPDAFSVADVLVPDRTRLDMKNLPYFAVRREWTPTQLAKMTIRDKVDPNWNLPLVRRILASVANQSPQVRQFNPTDLWERPEELAELLKEGALLYNSSAVPVINCWDFFQYDDEQDGWIRKIFVKDAGATPMEGVPDEFLYSGKKPYAKTHQNIIHWHFGNLCTVPPFRYYSVRSLGYLLYSVVHLQNRLRCKFTDAVFSELLWFFRVASEADIDRVQRVNLAHLGVIPDGLNIVTKNERYTPDWNLVTNALQQNRQLMAESASSFIQNINDGSNREMTAFEASLRMNSVNLLVNATLESAVGYEVYQYREVVRRFLIRNSRDRDVKKFWKSMQSYNFPPEAFDIERWTINPERPVGGGNKTMELMQTDRLMAVRPLLDPDPQRKVLHYYVMANTDDARMAEDLVPLEKKVLPSDTVVEAQQNAAAALGINPVSIVSGVNRAEYIVTCLKTLQAAVQRTDERGGMAKDAEEILGLLNLSQHIQANVQLLAQDESSKQVVAQLGQVLGQLMNKIKALQQRWVEQQQKQGGGENGQGDAEAWAEIQKELMVLGEKVRIRESASRQKLVQKQADWQANQLRKQAEWDAEQRRKQAEFAQDQGLKDADKALEVSRASETPPETTTK